LQAVARLFMLAAHLVAFARSLTPDVATSRTEARMPMMATTTRSSMSVKAFFMATTSF
jgi:hypothetical protein